MDDVQQRLVGRIRQLAAERGMSITHLPDRAGVGRAHFFAVLKGENSPSLRWITKVAAALEVDPAELLKPPGHDGQG